MEILVTSQSFSSVAWRISNGANPLSSGETHPEDLDDFLDWLRRSDPSWTITTSEGNDSIVISHWYESEIEKMRTTIDCDSGNYNGVLGRLKNLKASSQQYEREGGLQSALCLLK